MRKGRTETPRKIKTLLLAEQLSGGILGWMEAIKGPLILRLRPAFLKVSTSGRDERMRAEEEEEDWVEGRNGECRKQEVPIAELCID